MSQSQKGRAVSLVVFVASVVALARTVPAEGAESQTRIANLLLRRAAIDPQTRAGALESASRLESGELAELAQALGGEFGFEAAELLGNAGPSAIPVLREALSGGNRRVSSLAAMGLARLGAPAVPVLLEAMDSENPATRAAATSALGAVGARTDEAIDRLTLALADNGEHVCVTAARSLAVIGAPAAPSLGRALREGSPRLKRGAATALGLIGELADSAVPDLFRALDDQDAGVRESAAFALADLGVRTRLAVPELAALLGSEATTPYRRDYMDAAYELSRTGVPAIPSLSSLLRSERVNVRKCAAIALARLGQPAVAALLDALEDDSVEVRREAAKGLSLAGPAATGAVQELELALTDSDVSVRASSAMALGHVGVAALGATPGLGSTLRHDESPAVRMAAARALGAIGLHSDRPIPHLASALTDAHPEVRDTAADALVHIGEPSLSALAGKEAMSTPDLRALIGKTAARIEARAELRLEYQLPPELPAPPNEEQCAAPLVSEAGAAGIPFLVSALESPRWRVRRRAAWALGRAGVLAGPAIPHLVKALNDEFVSRHAVEALGEARGLGIAGLLDMHDMLRRPAGLHTESVVWAVSRCASGDPLAVRPLVRATRSLDPHVRIQAMGRLAELGPAGIEALPRLATVLREKEMSVASERYSRSMRASPPRFGEMKRLHQRTRLAAVRALAALGPPAAPILAEAVNDDAPEIRREAKEALRHVRRKG